MRQPTISAAWRNWTPSDRTVCDICRLPVAPISVGWAVVIDSAADFDLSGNNHGIPAHTCTVDGEAH